MNVFYDSSALVKRYVEETGSDRVDAILAQATSLGIAVLCAPEVMSALCRRRRENTLSPQQFLTAKRQLFQDIAYAEIVNLSDPVVANAVRIMERWPLRAADALHLAAAAEWPADVFVSADKRQTAVAREYGMRVELIPAG